MLTQSEMVVAWYEQCQVLNRPGGGDTKLEFRLPRRSSSSSSSVKVGCWWLTGFNGFRAHLALFQAFLCPSTDWLWYVCLSFPVSCPSRSFLLHETAGLITVPFILWKIGFHYRRSPASLPCGASLFALVSSFIMVRKSEVTRNICLATSRLRTRTLLVCRDIGYADPLRWRLNEDVASLCSSNLWYLPDLSQWFDEKP